MSAARRGVENAAESAVVRKNDDPISTDVISGLFFIICIISLTFLIFHNVSFITEL